MTPNLELLLEGLPALRGLPPASLDELEGAVVRRAVVAGEYLFRQHAAPPTSAYFLLSASVDILLGPPGDERPVGQSHPGQLVGWVTLSATDLFPVSARIVEPGEVLEISAETLRHLLGQHPVVGLILASEMARHLQDLFQGFRREAAHSPLHRIVTFPFRAQLRHVMASPVVTLPPEVSARRAALAMDAARTGSVAVSEGEALRGIVTEQDLVRRILASGRDPDAIPLEQVMSSPVASLEPQDYAFQALGIMRRHRMQHIVVIEKGQPVGIVSMRSLVEQATSETLELMDRIENAESFEAIAAARTMSHAVCSHLLGEGIPGDEVSHVLSRINRELHRQVLEITVRTLETEGWGQPPAGFCFILMGSHGRHENHFNTDQDHGMILADYPPRDWQRVEPYFMELGSRVSERLTRVGYGSCRGQVMSSNPVWRKPVKEWKAQIEGWYANPSSNAVRYSTLFYDFQPIWGQASLAEELRAFITAGVQRNHQLLRSLYEEASRHKVPLTWLRNFITDKTGPHKGQMDLKRSGFLFVVECARILALRHGVSQTSTVERLKALSEKGVIPLEEAEFVQTAYKTLMHFLLKAQAGKLRAGQPVDNHIEPRALPIQERYALRHALEATSRLQRTVHAGFGDIFF